MYSSRAETIPRVTRVIRLQKMIEAKSSASKLLLINFKSLRYVFAQLFVWRDTARFRMQAASKHQRRRSAYVTHKAEGDANS